MLILGLELRDSRYPKGNSFHGDGKLKASKQKCIVSLLDRHWVRMGKFSLLLHFLANTSHMVEFKVKVTYIPLLVGGTAKSPGKGIG